jgi:transposase
VHGHRSPLYPPELRERAVRMVAEVRDDYESEWTAISSVAGKLGIRSAETVRAWIRKGQVDSGQRPGVRTDTAEELWRLRAESRELKRTNEILQSASFFFAASLDRRNK